MATVREGSRGVLLVVDVQAGVVRDAWDAPRVVANLARLVERARAAGLPVIWVQHAETWLSYPGRSTTTARAEAVDLGALAGAN